MRRISMLAALVAVSTAASAQPSAATTHDVQCFMLYAAAIAEATDDKTRFAASSGTMYFYGKLKAEAPGLDLEQAIRIEAEKLTGNPNASAIGKACDVEVQKRGDELKDLGGRLQQPAIQSSPSSS